MLSWHKGGRGGGLWYRASSWGGEGLLREGFGGIVMQLRISFCGTRMYVLVLAVERK